MSVITKTFNIRDHVDFDRNGRAYCPSCSPSYANRKKTLALVPETDGAYKCFRGCSPTNIREALGTPLRGAGGESGAGVAGGNYCITSPASPALSAPPPKPCTVPERQVKQSTKRLLQRQGEPQEKAIAWLENRGITREMVAHFRIGLEPRWVVSDEDYPEQKECYWAIALFIPCPDKPGQFYVKKRVAPWLSESERPDYLQPWSQYGVKRTIYFTYLPEDAIATYYCEGEWDAILLGWLAYQRGEKIAVSCSTHGCGSTPSPEQLEQLPGKVYSFFDRNDKLNQAGKHPGDEAAKELAIALEGRGKIAQVPMPEGCEQNGWDVSDALNVGYTWEDFQAAAMNAKEPVGEEGVPPELQAVDPKTSTSQSNSNHRRQKRTPPADGVAEWIAEKYRSRLLFNNEIKTWMRYEADLPGVWSGESDEYIEAIVSGIVNSMGINGYGSNSYITNIVKKLRHLLIERKWVERSSSELLPFSNGVLDLATGKLLDHSPGYRFTWSLPREHDPNAADWNTIGEFLEFATGGDSQLKKILLCFANAVLKGRSDLQKFLYLIGVGGSGKGSYFQLLCELIGIENVLSTTLEDWCNNRFEAANAYRKRLVLFWDEDKKSGRLGKFKSLTGGDWLRAEEKGKKAFSYKFDGMVALSSNFPIFAGDNSSGLSRRMNTVPMKNPPAPGQRRHLLAEWQPELAAFTNYALSIPDEEVTRTLLGLEPSPEIDLEFWEGRLRTDSIAAWLNDWVIRDPMAQTPVGSDKNEAEWGAPTTLYGSYSLWCKQHGAQAKANKNFSPDLLELCHTILGWEEVQKITTKTGKLIQGLRLRTPADGGIPTYEYELEQAVTNGDECGDGYGDGCGDGSRSSHQGNITDGDGYNHTLSEDQNSSLWESNQQNSLVETETAESSTFYSERGNRCDQSSPVKGSRGKGFDPSPDPSLDSSPDPSPQELPTQATEMSKAELATQSDSECPQACPEAEEGETSYESAFEEKPVYIYSGKVASGLMRLAGHDYPQLRSIYPQQRVVRLDVPLSGTQVEAGLCYVKPASADWHDGIAVKRENLRQE